MIKETQPLSMQEANEILGEIVETEKTKQLEIFIKKFSKIKLEKAKQLREELENLDLLKMKEENLIKIIDLLPEDSADLNKVFTENPLNEDETNKILEIVKKYK